MYSQQQQNLKLTMKTHVFDRYDTTKIFDLLTRFVNDSKMLNMLASQAFNGLPTFLANTAETQFHTNKSGASRRGAVTC